MSKKIMMTYDIGDQVWVVHPTETLYRWIIDGPLTVKEVIEIEKRILYQFVEFQKDGKYVGYTADRVFSTFQDAVTFRAQMLRKYKYFPPNLNNTCSLVSNIPNPTTPYPRLSEAVETNRPSRLRSRDEYGNENDKF